MERPKMNIYDSLIVGSGYSSVGYASANANTLICEEHQICDTGFYLPMRTFRYVPYVPRSAVGEELFRIFNSLSLFDGKCQNLSGFEYAISRYIADKGINLLLRCRAVNISPLPDGILDVTLSCSEGLVHVLTRKIIDTTATGGRKKYTVLFVTDKIETERDKILAALDGAQIEPAFYKGRYALHLSPESTDENLVKLEIYKKWKSLDTSAKILYMSPVFYSEGTSVLCDGKFLNPIEAFEAGYFYKEAE